MVTFNLCGIMLLPLFCVIVVQIKRMASQSQAFAYCYLRPPSAGRRSSRCPTVFFGPPRFDPPATRPDHGAQRPGLDLLVAPVGMALART